MANNVKISDAAANALVDAVVDRIDLDTPPGVIEIRTGTQPADPDVAATGTLLATLTFSNPAFGATSSRTATASSITDDSSADASGTAAWARMETGTAGTGVIDCEVGSSGADINFNSVSFTAGDSVSITSLTVSYPG